jgi:magnesium-protoporphyrin IX monomethyl ester (oxidative) cyclase
VPNGVSVGTLDRELLELFAQTNCTRLSLAVESGCQDTLDRIIGKHLRLEKVQEVVHICRDLGIKTTAFFVIGLPGETPASMEESMDFAARLPVSTISVMAACPYPGTRLARQCDENGYYREGFNPYRIHTLYPQIETPEFSAEYVRKLIARTRIAHAMRYPWSSVRRVAEKAMVAPTETARTLLGSLKP